jgi:NAD+ synthase (glutamine-hydrolysing)
MDSPLVPLRLALAQINPTVGAIAANTELIAASIADAKAAGADIVLLPELAVTGYPPEDLLLKRHFLDAADQALEDLAAGAEGIVALVGCPHRRDGLHNGLAVLADGGVRTIYRKVLLPNYGVFDERRYFEPGPSGELIEVNGIAIGLTICEDVWFAGPPISSEAEAGAALVLNASASPYHRGRGMARERTVAERARENEVAVALCNMVGGQDELVFDGHSVVVDAGGRTLARGAQFEPELLVCDLLLPARDVAKVEVDDETDELLRLRTSGASPASSRTDDGSGQPPRLAASLDDVEEVYSALRLGLADYVAKNGFHRVVLGLSGGIDSALVAVLAADALGGDRVSCVVMPSPHSSDATQSDAREIARNIGAELIEIEIGELMDGYRSALEDRFGDAEPGLAEENLQARIRGNLIMALSNRFGWLPLATGNKSEMSVGYATLYGDMAGGFALIKDVPKTLVFELVAQRNRRGPGAPVPAAVVERPPSAELRPDQLDTDSLPPYEILDAALAEYVERDGGRDSMIAAGIAPEVAEHVIGLVDRAEYKRRQAPPGVKITPKSFGRDRRMPITNRFGG